MRRFVFSILMAVCHAFVSAQTAARITIENNSGVKVSLQPEDSDGYDGDDGAVREIAVSRPCYYRLVCGDAFHTVYVTPGADIKVSCGAGGVVFSGTNKAENGFIQANRFLCRAPEGVRTYSREWIEYNEKELQRLYDKLDRSGLDKEFIAIHKLYLGYVYLNQKLGGVQTAVAFRQDVELAGGFYDFLNDLEFDDGRILSIPRWFRVVDGAMEEMERQGLISVSNGHYVKYRAMRIADEGVRSHYIVELLRLMLKKGYLDDFMSHYEEVAPMVTSSEAARELPDVLEQYRKVSESNLGISRGTQMPDFTAHTLDGRTVCMSDLKGQILILDFWFTGCVPCKAERPHFDRLARELKGRDVRFVSISLDTGVQLLSAWRKIAGTSDAESEVMDLNLDGGFKSDFVKRLNIRSVPRIMLVDRDGKIIDAYAKKPSDPKLRQQIEQLLD